MTQRDDAPPLIDKLRAHGKASDSIAWNGQARQLLLWAADAIEAANVALSETAPRLPQEPTHAMLKALAGDPVILAGSDEAELRLRYAAMLAVSPACASPNRAELADRLRAAVVRGYGCHSVEEMMREFTSFPDDIRWEAAEALSPYERLDK